MDKLTLTPTADMDIQEGSLAWEIRAFSLSMNEKRASLLSHHGISESDIDILRFLNTHEVKKMKDLGDLFGLKFSTLTSTVDRLENNRLVKRKSSKEDRRVVFVTIASRGQAFLKDLTELYVHVADEFVKTMNATQVGQISDILHKLNTK